MQLGRFACKEASTRDDDDNEYTRRVLLHLPDGRH